MLLVIIIVDVPAKATTLAGSEATIWLVVCIVCVGDMLACNILCILG